MKVLKKIFLKKIKAKLEKERAAIKKELEKFAKKNPKLKEDWKTRFPHFNGESGGSRLEGAADEVEEYSTLLPIEYSLETRLRDIEIALEKIKKGKYGKCEKCHGEIPEDRLRVYPEARFCLKCQK